MRDKIKVTAQRIALRKVEIPKEKKCEICNKRFAEERHHEDYSKPLEVNFYCRKCHMRKDGRTQIFKGQKKEYIAEKNKRNKGKNYEEIFGKDKAKVIRKKQSDSTTKQKRDKLGRFIK